MHTQLPKVDTVVKYVHPTFTELLNSFHLPFKAVAPLSTSITLSANTKGSDIKWNDMAGTLTMQIFDANQKMVGDLMNCQLVHFTGNCGVKAASHIFLQAGGSVETYKALLAIIESFAYHRTNCGILMGSDTEQGRTLGIVQKYGSKYQFTEKTWNPNYTWSGAKDHKIVAFWKMLNEEKHTDYWQNGTPA